MVRSRTVNWEPPLVDISEPLSTDQAPSMAEIGFLLIGHGTRSSDGRAQFRKLFDLFRQALLPRNSEMAFLELAEPNIETALRKLKAVGVRRVLTVPVLLFAAGHAKSDVPSAVLDACERHGLEAVGQASALELERPILKLSERRFREALADAPSEGQNTDGGVALAMIGRGSSDPTATNRMHEFTQARVHLTPVDLHVTGFMHAQEPDLEGALDVLEASSYRHLVVQPHLLFAGELLSALEEAVDKRQARTSSRHWILTQALGVDPSLADLLAILAERALQSELS